jgi:hypothetical protein
VAWIILPDRWLERPTHKVRLMCEHPLARGLRAFYDLRAGVWQINQVTGKIGGTLVGTGPFLFSKWIVTANSTTNYANLDTGGFNIATVPWTVITGNIRTAGTVNWSLLRRDIATFTGCYQQAGAYLVSNANDFSGSVTPSVVVKSSRGVTYGAVALVGTNNLRGTTGGAVTVDTVVVGPAAGTITSCLLGASALSAVSNQSTTNFEYWGIYDKALPDGALQEICRNPWQIFEPDEPRIYVTVPAGGAIDATLAATEQDDTLTATAAVAITATAAITEQDDTLTAAGQVTITATAAITEQDDTLTATATTGGAITATLVVTEQDDTLAATAVVDQAAAEQQPTVGAGGQIGRRIRKPRAPRFTVEELPRALAAINARLAIQQSDDRLVAFATVTGESTPKRRARRRRAAAELLLH